MSDPIENLRALLVATAPSEAPVTAHRPGEGPQQAAPGDVLVSAARPGAGVSLAAVLSG